MLDVSQTLLLGVPVALSVSTLSALHWYPWNKGTKPLGRVAAYTVGTAVVVGYPIAAMLAAIVLGLPQNELFWAGLLATNTFASGAAVNIAYWIDGNRAVGINEVNSTDDEA